MEGLALYEAKVCECGLHESVADEDPDLELDYRVCPVCAGTARQMRIQHAEDDEQLGEKPAPSKVRPDDGRYVRLRHKPPPAPPALP